MEEKGKMSVVVPVSEPAGVIAWLFVGLVAGFLASVVFRGSLYPIAGNIIMGIVGAFIGGFLASFLIHFDLIGSIIIAFIGSCIFIGGLRIIAAITTSIPRVDQEQPVAPPIPIHIQLNPPPVQQRGSPPPAQGFTSSSTHFSPPTLSIFVSHSSKDDDFGLRLVNDLRKAFGSSEAIWYDSEGGLYGGDSWWSRIVSVLATCDVFIIVLSPNSMSSKWVVRELDIAVVEGKRIVPVLYRQCDIRPDLRAIQTIS